MKLHTYFIDQIKIPQNRQRRIFTEDEICELSASIADNGLIHPVVVRKDENDNIVLVAGERRIKALQVTWDLGQEVRCGEHIIPENIVPCLFLGEIDPIDAFEIELEENIRRTDLSWQEKATAVSQLLELRSMQAERAGELPPTMLDLAKEVSGQEDIQCQTAVREDVILARNMDNPVVAKAPTKKEALKALKRDEERKRFERLGAAIGPTITAVSHFLLNEDCLEAMVDMKPASFDVILSDPPYGIGADEFGDSGGKTAGSHAYDDSYESWTSLMARAIPLMTQLAKLQSHLYLFCDVDNFVELKILCAASGWKVFRTPLIWVNPSAMRAPWPDAGPQRKWQAILYATRGGKTVTRLYSDVLTYSSDQNLGHQAQKPVLLYQDLLRRSIAPGDSVLDPFCGTGTIFPAAHELKCKATGIEKDQASYGIASQRLKDLK